MSLYRRETSDHKFQKVDITLISKNVKEENPK